MTTINAIFIAVFAYLAGSSTSPLAITYAGIACVLNIIAVAIKK